MVLRRRIKLRSNPYQGFILSLKYRSELVLTGGLESPRGDLQDRCSTSELCQHGAAAVDQTPGLPLTRRALYQLSYSSLDLILRLK